MSDAALPPTRRNSAVVGLAISVLVLLPGLLLPVITVTGTLEPEGIAALAPHLLEQGISDEAMNSLRPMLNPAMLPLMELMPGGLKGALISSLGSQLAEQLKEGPQIEVYRQTRSILGSVRHLYSVGSGIAATLILLFSVFVPFTKASLAMWAVYNRNVVLRERTLNLVETIAKWSMADVFAVALFITYLAAQASQSPPSVDAPPAVVTFDARFGAGFYWFAAYCLFSLGVQQATARWVRGARKQLAG